MQLNKYLAHAGICSRRKADELIGFGTIAVNGVPVTNVATRLKEGDRVTFRGKLVQPEKHVYILLNKPAGVVATAADDRGRKTVLDLVHTPQRCRLYPVGRLDYATTGVMLLTNDGELAQRLSHPRFRVEKRYRVQLKHPLTSEQLTYLRAGVQLSDGFF